MTETMNDILDTAIEQLETEEDIDAITSEARELAHYLMADCYGEAPDAACVALTVTLGEILDQMDPATSMAMKLAIINTLTKGPCA